MLLVLLKADVTKVLLALVMRLFPAYAQPLTICFQGGELSLMDAITQPQLPDTPPQVPI